MMNRFFTLLLAASCLTAFGQVPDYVPTEGLVAWYPLDGDVEAAGAGGQDGLNLGAEATEDRDGNSSSAMLFVSTELDRVELGHGFSTGNQPKSFAFWVRCDVSQYQWFLSGGDGDADGKAFGLFQDPNASQASLVFHGNSSTYDFYFSSLEIQAWTHVAIVYNGNAVNAYLNGEFIDSKEVLLDTSSDQIWLGARNNFDNGTHFSGSLDDVGIWSRALDDIEVLALFANEQPILGCTNGEACNFNIDAVVDDGSCVPSGCTDSHACNFTTDAACDDGSCDYSCCPGPGCCLDGQHWDWELNGCVITNPSDSNFDGCVQLNDLLDLLSAYGDCGAEEAPWQCGDQLEYQGYDYETVQIGEQCWFAENLRTESYRNGDLITADLDNSAWSLASDGASAVYGEGEGCEESAPNIDACNASESLQLYGRHYNGYAAMDPRGICPTSWRVPTDDDWYALTTGLGDSLTIGAELKAEFGWNDNGNGSDSVGFGALPAGLRRSSGNFDNAGRDGGWWSSTSATSETAWNRDLSYGSSNIERYEAHLRIGFSVRCIKDAD